MPKTKFVELQDVAQLFRALGDPARLAIVAILANCPGRDLCPRHFERILGFPQAVVSRHLATLRNAGVVHAERRGSWVHYGLVSQVDPHRRAVFSTLIKRFGLRDDLRKKMRPVVEAVDKAVRDSSVS